MWLACESYILYHFLIEITSIFYEKQLGNIYITFTNDLEMNTSLKENYENKVVEKN
jgi:hypothetical protein